MAFCFDGDIFTEQNRSKLSYYEFRLRYYEVEMASRRHQMPFRYDNKGL